MSYSILRRYNTTAASKVDRILAVGKVEMDPTVGKVEPIPTMDKVEPITTTGKVGADAAPLEVNTSTRRKIPLQGGKYLYTAEKV